MILNRRILRSISSQPSRGSPPHQLSQCSHWRKVGFAQIHHPTLLQLLQTSLALWLREQRKILPPRSRMQGFKFQGVCLSTLCIALRTHPSYICSTFIRQLGWYRLPFRLSSESCSTDIINILRSSNSLQRSRFASKSFQLACTIDTGANQY